MKNNLFCEIIKNKTNFSEQQIDIIDNIVGKNIVAGTFNRNSVIFDFSNQLVISEDKADVLYKICKKIIVFFIEIDNLNIN